MKRCFDILFSTIGLIIFSPLFFVLAICIIADSKGGVFYRQIRVGKNNVDFKLYKFRSMYVASEKKGLLTVSNHDSRITRVGYFIRKYKLDELPQLINVLLGDMSFVGPRPEVRKYVDLYTAEQMHVLDIRPGITDAASIKYRNENEILAQQTNPEKYYIDHIMPDKLSINLEYVREHSLGTDIQLIWETFVAIVRK